MAASIDDVYRELKELSAQMWRGFRPEPTAPVRNGMVPDIYDSVTSTLRDGISRVEDVVLQLRGNLDTSSGNFGQTPFARIDERQTEILERLWLIPTMRDIEEANEKREKRLVVGMRQDVAETHERLEGLKNDIEALKRDIQSLAKTP